jgi:hypothetical protein
MTVINNIEIDNIEYNKNEIKEAILNNNPIEENLHVVVVVSNPCLFARRYILMKEFINRIELEETNVLLYVVELSYNGRFFITQKGNKRHLQLQCKTPIWHKENMINLGVQKLLPKNWKAFAWIDADIEFENPSWAVDTLKILNGTKDIVQLFSHCVDMNQFGEAMKVFNSFGYQYTKRVNYTTTMENYWHPGYAWACTRKAYEKMGGLYDKGILGSGDNIMALSYIKKGYEFGLNKDNTEDYKNSVLEFQERVKNVRVGYVPGVIRHYYHGSKQNRQYGERWKILVKYKYSPIKHLKYDNSGLLVPTKECPNQLLDDIMKYFSERDEDDMYKTALSSKMKQISKVLSIKKHVETEDVETEEYDTYQEICDLLYNNFLSNSDR